MRSRNGKLPLVHCKQPSFLDRRHRLAYRVHNQERRNLILETNRANFSYLLILRTS